MSEQRALTRILSTGLVALLLIGAVAFSSQADFDGDGYADLAIGVSLEDVRSTADAGAVNVLYGTSNGLRATGDQIWDQDDLSADAGGAETQDYFGQQVAVGDLNGDGAADLVVGTPGEDIGTATNAGAVHIIYGEMSGGLKAAGDQFWHQGSPGVKGAVENHDFFGQALAIGDFNGDGYGDLAIGAPLENIEPVNNAGVVNVLYGSPAGPTGVGDQLWYEGHNGLSGTPETDDQFGNALVAGDFDADGYADLAISIFGEDLGGVNNAGRVVILYGSSSGLTAVDSQAWVQGLNGIKNGYEKDDYFGWSLATGDFNGDHFADLAIGVPDEKWAADDNAGMVHVLFGSSQGLTSTGNEAWTDSGLEMGDRYGSALAAGDFNGDGFDELAVGIPYEDLVDIVDSGAVEILYGASGGLHRRVAHDFWHQDRSGILDRSEAEDRFGFALAAGNFDDDEYMDLAIGIPYEDIGSKADAGAVQILYGSRHGLAAGDNQFWHQDSPHIEGAAETTDEFGRSLAAIPLLRPKLALPLMLLDH